MNSLIKLPIAILFLIFFSCQSNDPNHLAEESLKDEVMVIHDEVMPKMGEINRLRKKLINLKEEGQIPDSMSIEPINEAIEYLEKADDGMMDWMGEFDSPSKLRGKKTHEEIMAYLKEEKVKVEQVKYDILTSIKTAKEIFDNYNDEN